MQIYWGFTRHQIRGMMEVQPTTMGNTVEEQFEDVVKQFREKMNLGVSSHPRLMTPAELDFYEKFVKEEMKELRIAAENSDLVSTADAIGDLIYLLYGASLLIGVPMTPVLLAIHKANMRKEPGANKRGPNDAMKPRSWFGPETEIQEIIDDCYER